MSVLIVLVNHFYGSKSLLCGIFALIEHFSRNCQKPHCSGLFCLLWCVWEFAWRAFARIGTTFAVKFCVFSKPWCNTTHIIRDFATPAGCRLILRRITGSRTWSPPQVHQQPHTFSIEFLADRQRRTCCSRKRL